MQASLSGSFIIQSVCIAVSLLSKPCAVCVKLQYTVKHMIKGAEGRAAAFVENFNALSCC